MGASQTTGNGARAGRREWIGLAVLTLPTLLVSVDVSVLFLALPHLTADLGASSTEQLWISDIYGFMVAGFLVTMGTLGDRIGRRKLLLIGGSAFACASLLAAFSTTPEMLIVARALLGISGATLLPSTMALISSMFRDPKQMGVAIAVWGTAFMSGVALGPVIGGALLSTFWWGAVFLMGVPIMLLLVLSAPFLLPESRDPAGGRIDAGSVALSMVAILLVIYALKEFAKEGLEPLAIAGLLAGAAVGALFLRRQRGLADPLLDLSLFRHRSLTAALILSLFVGALQSGTGLLVALHLQTVAGFSPLESGLCLVPPALTLMLAINVSPHIARRVRPAFVLAGGMAIAVAGQLMIAQVDATGSVAYLITGVAVSYFGVGPAAALLNHLILDTAPPEKAGSASSVSGTAGEFGVAMGIAALGSLGAVVYQGALTVPEGVPGDIAAAAAENVNGAVASAGQVPPAVGTELLDSAREAFTSGLNVVAIVSAVLFAALGTLAVARLRDVPPTGSEHGEQSDVDSAAVAAH
ncbi:MFS transporter [Amycolatopsis antarctica]|uniref:MFS transporter n=1 Tax=Amycolatopsis antarctica TaxID=1854586 RepID=A0A263D0N2_9PSEU|nr:MFS transporter [Amycolatopsis antarctica]OZM71911.1 MFS transporter [Amycolatopsis antarctica]